MRARVAAILGAAVLTLTAAPAALADTTTSSNWAGYAVHRSGVTFRRVIGAWRVPGVTCTPGRPTYSATWIGLGGFSLTAPALEQIGTESDCTASGSVQTSAWYELVPSAGRTIRMAVDAGDVMAASVTVRGHRVTLGLVDETTHATYQRTLRAASVDISSAEWIEEAPSECATATNCTTLPLADFGTATFALARAQTTGGRSGTISSRRWTRTAIRLAASSPRFVTFASGVPAVAEATPSALGAHGSAFHVSFSTVAASPGRFSSTRRYAPRAAAPSAAARS
jgi:hypothetical protein